MCEEQQTSAFSPHKYLYPTVHIRVTLSLSESRYIERRGFLSAGPRLSGFSLSAILISKKKPL